MIFVNEVHQTFYYITEELIKIKLTQFVKLSYYLIDFLPIRLIMKKKHFK